MIFRIGAIFPKFLSVLVQLKFWKTRTEFICDVHVHDPFLLHENIRTFNKVSHSLLFFIYQKERSSLHLTIVSVCTSSSIKNVILFSCSVLFTLFYDVQIETNMIYISVKYIYSDSFTGIYISFYCWLWDNSCE